MKALARILVLATLWWLGPLASDVASAAEPASMSPPPRELSTMADRERVTLPPMTVPLDPPARDLRPFYVGLGLIVMATAFWWNRRQRDRFEREDDRVRHGRPPRTRPRPARETAVARDAAGARDDDADDLHAAARGDTPDPPDRPAP